MSPPGATNLAGWPFWASVIAHALGIAVASAAVVTPARSSPPPVPIQLVKIERPTPPPEPPKPRVVRAPKILHQPTTAPTPAPSAPASLLTWARRTSTSGARTTPPARGTGPWPCKTRTTSEQWKLMGGLRYDRFETDFENKFLRQEFHQVNHEVSPRAALVFLPTRQQTYYFSYGTSYNPSAEGLALAINTTSAEPEKNESYEVGAKWDVLGGRLGLAAAVFQIDKTNARTNDPLVGVQVNEGQQRVRGFEVSGVGKLLPNWNLFAGYTFLDSEVIDSLDVVSGIRVQGKTIPNVAQHTATLWTTYDITEQWQVGGGAVYVGKRFANNVNTIEVPWYARGDLTVAYRPAKQVELRANVINVSDERYVEQIHPGHGVPGAARTFLLTGTFSF
jgi:catecholate siderophore receptor